MRQQGTTDLRISGRTAGLARLTAMPAVVTLATLLGSGCGGDVQGTIEEDSAAEAAALDTGEVAFTEAQLRRIRRLGPLGPPPPDPTNRVADDPLAARLGQQLFYDPALSASGEVSCASCHDPELGFSDGRSLAVGEGTGTRRSPTLLNVAYQRWFFWDGRADSLWSQALGPLESEHEMGSSRLAVLHHLASEPELRAGYEGLFGQLPDLEGLPPHARPVEEDPDHPHATAWSQLQPEQRAAIDSAFASVGKLLASYQRRLVSRDAPFDRWLGGEVGALDESALRGLQLFVGRANCTLCHNGPLLSDLEFHNTSAPPLDGGELEDPGRYRGVQRLLASSFHAASVHSDEPDGPAARRLESLRDSSETWGEFKTPSLRNLGHRAPLMHQGQFPDLPAVLRFYATLEGAGGRNHHAEDVLAPFELTSEDEQDLLAFLDSLEGQPVPSNWLEPTQR